MVKHPQFENIANKLTKVSLDVLLSTAFHLEQEGRYTDLDSSQQEALDLLKHVNTISAKIPGSQATKISSHVDMQSHLGYFSIPHLYFTANPNPAHNPVLQVMFGDQRYPGMVPTRDRALRLAKDPVAATDFFQFCIEAIFQDLFGWDYHKKKKSSEYGGILGKLCAFFGTAELTECATFHAHFIMVSWWFEPNRFAHEIKSKTRV